MGMPTWWNERRYGLFVHTTLASVPAWAPIGAYSEWYQSHVGEDVADALLQQPMAEVLAHHRDRWGHIEQFDDFHELLTFDRFDAEEWARLAVDAGMSYTVFVAKHHDGLCWWDAPGTDRTVLNLGPKRNVLGEFAAACERNDLTFGTYYSLLDWADPRYPGADYVTDVLHAQCRDLVERYGSSVLWGDGHWGHDGAHWRSDELFGKLRTTDPSLVANDRWATTAGAPAVRTFEYDPPADITPGPWELCRGIGQSFGHNRNERAEHHLSGHGIVALLTEVVAKGGNLLLNVGPAADGSIPDLQARPLREAGTWVRSFEELLSRSTPWTTWGDDIVRYFLVDGAVHGIDLTGRGWFPAIDQSHCATHSVTQLRPGGEERTIGFTTSATGLQLEVPRGIGSSRSAAQTNALDVAVYRFNLSEVEQPDELFANVDQIAIPLAPLLTSAQPGEIVQLGDGVYSGPAVVPPGVILRGLGAARTRIDGGGALALTLGRSARVEHLTIGGAAQRTGWRTAPAVEIDGQFGSLLGCDVDGHIVVRGDDALVRASTMVGLVAKQVSRLTVSRCHLRGNRWDVGVRIVGGADHDIDSCEIHNHLCGVRLTDTNGAAVRGNDVESRWWGVHLERAERAHVHGNRIRRTMRAINVDGGAAIVVDGNAVADGDSGCLVERGAADCDVSGNRWERCRVGLLAWEAGELSHRGNQAIDLHEPDQAITIH